MQILVLEDDPERITQFMESLKHHTVEYCMSAKSCIALLQDREWDWLFLDHDLGSERGTGYDVALWLEENPDHIPEFGTVIHSLNQVGAERIYSAVPGNAWVMPGCWSDPNLEAFLQTSSV